jgi:phenylacetaldehyde dehydrogenase
MTVTLDRNVEQFIGAPRQLFINGQWAHAASGKTFATPNPATGETLANIAEGEAEDIDRAVRAARRAGAWCGQAPRSSGTGRRCPARRPQRGRATREAAGRPEL